MRRQTIKVILIAVLTFFAINLSYPKYFNQGVDYINKHQLSVWGFKLQMPHFWVKPFRLGLDLQGGTHLLYEADLSNIASKDYDSAMQGLRDVVERRVNLFGVQEPMVQVQEALGHYRLIVELAGIKDPAEAIRMIGQTPFLEFREQRSQEETEKISAKRQEVNDKANALQQEGKSEEEIIGELQKIEDWSLALEDPNFKPGILTGRYLSKAEPGFDQTTYRPLVLLQFNDEGAEIFKDLTSRNVGMPLAILIDGVVISAPRVQEPISGGRAQITGDFTVEEAKELAHNLNAGALPVPITLISQQTVGPTLGAVSLEQSLRAGIYGFLAVILFMMVFYRLSGFLASLALVIYVALILSLFKLIPVTLTLAGIGGFFLSIGMAVDANVLIFSRMREELRQGKGFSLALKDGFSRAWPSIRDGNVTTLVVALILFGLGSSFVKGFAFTLILGVLMSIFSAVFVTRSFLEVFSGGRLEKRIRLWR